MKSAFRFGSEASSRRIWFLYFRPVGPNHKVDGFHFVVPILDWEKLMTVIRRVGMRPAPQLTVAFHDEPVAAGKRQGEGAG